MLKTITQALDLAQTRVVKLEAENDSLRAEVKSLTQRLNNISMSHIRINDENKELQEELLQIKTWWAPVDATRRR